MVLRIEEVVEKRVWIPPHVRNGRPVEGYWRESRIPVSALKPDLPTYVERKLDNDGGVTVHRFTGNEPKHGIAVAVAPTESLDIGPEVPEKQAEDLIAQWVHDHTRKKGPSLDDKNIYMGGWLDESTGHIWMDLVQVYPPEKKADAILAGQQANQIAVFDLGTHEEIPTGGTGLAKAGPVRRFFIADAKTEPYKLAEWVVAMRTKIEKREPRDGDGDGFILDGKPGMRPVGRVKPVKITANRKKKFAGRDGKKREHKYDVTVGRRESASSDRSMEAAAESLGTGGKQGPMAGFVGLNPDQMLSQMVGNLEVLHEEAVKREKTDGFVSRTRQWYDGANRMAAELAEQSSNPELSKDAAAGVMAVLSSSMDWDNNVFGAREVVRLADANPEVDDFLVQRFRGLRTALNTDKKGRPKKPGSRGYLVAPAPEPRTKLMDIKDPRSRALMLRVMSVRDHGGRPTTPLLEIGKDGIIRPRADGKKQKTRYQSSENIAKALSIYEHPTKANLDRQLGNGVKVRSFYNNIAYPDAPDGDVTVDTHAASSLVGAPYAATAEPFKANIERSNVDDGPVVKLMMIDAYRTMAKRHPEWYRSPREAQSVLWEMWREAAESSTKAAKERKAQLRQSWADVDVAEDRGEAVDRARGLIREFVSSTGVEKRERITLNAR